MGTRSRPDGARQRYSCRDVFALYCALALRRNSTRRQPLFVVGTYRGATKYPSDTCPLRKSCFPYYPIPHPRAPLVFNVCWIHAPTPSAPVSWPRLRVHRVVEAAYAQTRTGRGRSEMRTCTYRHARLTTRTDA
eukprot:3656915-Pleurochrysis_carterae.AAC.2